MPPRPRRRAAVAHKNSGAVSTSTMQPIEQPGLAAFEMPQSRRTRSQARLQTSDRLPETSRPPPLKKRTREANAEPVASRSKGRELDAGSRDPLPSSSHAPTLLAGEDESMESFAPLAVSSLIRDGEGDSNEDDSEDHVSRMLWTVAEGESQNPAAIDEHPEVVIIHSEDGSSSQIQLSFSLPPSSPPAKLSSVCGSSPSPSPPKVGPDRHPSSRPTRGPVPVLAAETASVAGPESSSQGSTDPYGFFAAERRLQTVKAKGAKRLAEAIELETEQLAQEPSVHLPEGLPFASSDKEDHGWEDEELPSEEMAAEPTKRKATPTPTESSHGEHSLPRPRRKAARKAARGPANVLPEALNPILPRRKTRTNVRRTGKAARSEQENVESSPAGRKVSTKTAKRSKVDGKKRGKPVDSGVEREFIGIDDEEHGAELRARQKRLDHYKDLESYDLVEELVW